MACIDFSRQYWGVSLCTIDGQRFSVGDVKVPFTIQSCRYSSTWDNVNCIPNDYTVISKPLTYAIALNELGQETVHRYVGQEPSGRMFNELILDYNSKSSLYSQLYFHMNCRRYVW